MTSEVQICNLALSHLGAYKIQSLGGASREARECNTLYESTRNATLAAHDWGFARKYLTMALLTETYSKWTYAYAYPTDCLAARKITDDTGVMTGTSYDFDTERYAPTGKIEFEIIANAALNGRVILTNKAAAELVYTGRVTDTNMFSTLFNDAFSFRMAADLAVPLKGKFELQQAMMKQFLFMIGQAQAEDANQDYKKPENVNSFVRARN